MVSGAHCDSSHHGSGFESHGTPKLKAGMRAIGESWSPRRGWLGGPTKGWEDCKCSLYGELGTAYGAEEEEQAGSPTYWVRRLAARRRKSGVGHL